MPRAAGFSPPVARGVTDAAIPRPGGRPAYHQRMSPDESDDPGADTAMFRAYVEEGSQPAAGAQGANRWVIVAAVAAVVIVLLALVLAL